MRLRGLFGAIDQGTTSTRFSLFTRDGGLAASHQVPIPQYYRGPGEHTQDPKSYLTATLECIGEAVRKAGVTRADVVGVGITNQRETIVAWDRRTKEPLAEAIVWDDVRTAQDCDALATRLGGQNALRAATGLPINPYFSASKIAWLIRNNPLVKSALDQGNCCFSTVDSWLLSQLTDTPCPVTDISNASRTLLMNLQGKWEDRICELFGVPQSALPGIRSSAEIYGKMTIGALEGVPICGALGDQQAALLGHGCTQVGQMKNTYGTGSFLLVNTGNTAMPSSNGLITTVYGQFGPSAPITYALEGAIEAAGSCVNWAISSLNLAKDLSDFTATAQAVPDNGGVYFVPALGGLFTPYWRNDARGLFIGMTHHTVRGHLLRAILEGIAFRTGEAVKAVERDMNRTVEAVSVDGGMVANPFFLQLQADICGKRLEVPASRELTSVGAALAARVGCGDLKDWKEAKNATQTLKHVQPTSSNSDLLWAKWKDAVPRSFNWAK